MTKRRQYGTGSVYQRKSDGRWIGTIEAGYTAKGTRRRIPVTAKTEAECKRKVRDRIKDLEAGVVTTVSPRTTVKAWSDIWLERTSHTIRPKSWNSNASAVRQWVWPTFGHKRIGDVTPADIEAMNVAMRTRHDKPLATSSMNRNQNVVNQMFKDAIIEGHKVHSGIILTKKTGITRSDRAAMSLTQGLDMLKIIEGERDPSRWVAAILNGVRQGERLGLTVDCIDFAEHELDISWQLQELHYNDNKNKHLGFRLPDDFECRQLEGRFHLTRPKTAAGERRIPMTVWFEAALREWLTRAPESPHGLVWSRPDGGPIDAKDDRLEWYRMQKDAKVAHPAGRPFFVHENRHTTITLLKELGIPDDVIEQIVGQSKLVKSYVHQNLKPKTRAALESLGAQLQLGSLVGNEA